MYILSVVSYAELRVGLEIQTASRAQDERVLALLIQRISVLPFGESDTISFGVLRAAVHERRRDTMDQLIAAHALSAGLTLVTSNEADFKDYPGLSVENWVSARRITPQSFQRIAVVTPAPSLAAESPVYTIKFVAAYALLTAATA